jgi:hypothetical protein
MRSAIYYKLKNMISKKIAQGLLILILFTSFKNKQPNNTISGQWQLVCISNINKTNNSYRPTNYDKVR